MALIRMGAIIGMGALIGIGALIRKGALIGGRGLNQNITVFEFDFCINIWRSTQFLLEAG